ncbi:hypothetical protein O1L60_02830 [Streptomyces diastatochromogenes]|nr:hypothetical protein [Streptomyces diastatochromogenes]
MLFLSGAEVEPLREVFADLMELPEVRRHLAGMVSGLDIRYDVGPGTHPLLGARVPGGSCSDRTGRRPPPPRCGPAAERSSTWRTTRSCAAPPNPGPTWSTW